jgi:hypothetical protein
MFMLMNRCTFVMLMEMSVSVLTIVMMVMLGMTVGMFVRVANFLNTTKIATTTISTHFKTPPATPTPTRDPDGRMN